MLGLFGTLNMASRALQTQMAGVEVAGQNLANVNTPGYSRQRVVIQSDLSIPTSAGLEGTGASVQTIERVVDEMLNGQIQNQASQNGYWNSQQRALESLQTSLNEFLDSTGSASAAGASAAATTTGLADRLGAFFNALKSLATTPASLPARQAVIGAAQTLAATFKQINSRLSNLHTALDDSLNSQVSATNQLLTDIASLNDQIANAENFTNGGANDLRDRRQQKLEELSKYLDYQSSTGPNGGVTVTALSTQVLVAGNQVVNPLKTVTDATTGELQVWAVNTNNVLTGVSYGLQAGSLEGTIDVRDGQLNTLQRNLNTLAANLISQVNTLHSTGFNLAGAQGNPFFTGANAAGIAVNQTIANDASLLQASGTAGANGDGSVALSLAQLASTNLAALGNQTFSGSYAQSVAQVGEALRNANDQAATQTSVASLLANQRSSVSGVNLDEEMTNLMTYQRAYQASAHVVTTVDQMLQILLTMKA